MSNLLQDTRKAHGTNDTDDFAKNEIERFLHRQSMPRPNASPPTVLADFIATIPTAPANEVQLSEQAERGRRRMFLHTHGFSLAEAINANTAAL